MVKAENNHSTSMAFALIPRSLQPPQVFVALLFLRVCRGVVHELSYRYSFWNDRLPLLRWIGNRITVMMRLQILIAS